MAREQYLYHYSEDPYIRLFEPRQGRQIEGRRQGEKLIWAIDEYYSPVYFFPRECPRVLLWSVAGSIQEDIDRWLGPDARMVAHIESAWVERFEACELYRYSFDPIGFESLDDHGVYVKSAPVEPVDIAPVGNLGDALAKANVELRVVDSLKPLAEAWYSTVHFSGVRMRNAQNWVVPVGNRPR